MKYFRRRRLRLSLIVIVALLWSQVLLAWHGDCAAALVASEVSAAVAVHDHCVEPGDPAGRAVCEAHCNGGDITPASPLAALAVPALPPDPLARIAVALQLAGDAPSPTPARTAAAWHRPTHHRASVLLI
ncbi:MAG: hypothetical protein DYH17_00135 [Xanthomonadales bacterium PRO6]|nr:hypothetical protein [Xanthomonadales bacterium]MCE7929773.1 hypothetical protein [Xanthomonadales bacterium PRO6]